MGSIVFHKLQPRRTGNSLVDASLSNALSGSASGHSLDTLLAKTINTANTTPYDRAIDSVYLAHGTGGSHLHHFVDGHHDLIGAFLAAHLALPNDSIGSEILGTAHHLSKDLFSDMGLPVVSLDPGTYRSSSTWITNHLGISRSWQSDLLQINGMELFGGCLAAAGVIVAGRNRDDSLLAEIAGASGLSGVLAANPISMAAAAIALYLAINSITDPSRRGHLTKSGVVGTAGAASVFLTGNLLGGLAAAGTVPLIGSLALSLAVGIVVRRVLREKLLREKTAKANTQPPGDPAELIWRGKIIELSSNIRQSINDK